MAISRVEIVSIAKMATSNTQERMGRIGELDLDGGNALSSIVRAPVLLVPPCLDSGHHPVAMRPSFIISAQHSAHAIRLERARSPECRAIFWYRRKPIPFAK